MAYNHQKAVNEWIKWKREEEKQLRELGVSEETIQRLHTYDWAQFNSERRYLQRWQDGIDLLQWIEDGQVHEIPRTVEELLESIENEALLQTLKTTDMQTVKMLFLRSLGYSSREIAQKTGVSEDAVNNRICRLKKKLKKFF